MPGEYIDLIVETLPSGGTLGTFQWAIPAKTFKDYTSAEAGKGEVTRLANADYQNNSIQFYWQTTGNKAVSVTANLGYDSGTGNDIISVVAPTSSLDVTIEGVVSHEKDFPNQGEDTLGVFKDNMGGAPGVEFAGSVQVPAGYAAGSWRFVQTVNSKHVHKYPNNITKSLITNTPVLDTLLPYWTVQMIAANTPTLDCPTGNAVYTMWDTPYFPFRFNNETPDSAEMEDDFVCYLLFKPAGAKSKYVSLKAIDWSWKGKVTLGNNNAYTLNAGAFVTFSDTFDWTDHPEWTKNIKLDFTLQ